MQFLLSALGSAGDVHPFIAVGQALRSRGHEVRLLAARPFEERVRRAGLDFVPLGAPGDYERMLQRPELWDARNGSRHLFEELLGRLPEAYERTAESVMGPGTVLVGSTLSWSTRLLQEQRGLHTATLHLAPSCLISATDPSVLPRVGDLSWMPAPLLRAVQRLLERLAIDPLMTPPLNALRQRLGLSPVRRVLSHWMHSPERVICAWPDWFAAPQADWPPHSVTTGFPLFAESAGAPLARDLEAFLDAGPPPVGITPGSAMAHGARFFEFALAACDALGLRALVVTPYRDQLPARLPPGVHHVAYAPFGALLPRLAALVHHGGIGTSAQALAAGIPQLVVPFAHDQFDNAVRLRRLGVAHSPKPGGSYVPALRDLLQAPATAPAVRSCAARMADGEPPAERIADLLLSLS